MIMWRYIKDKEYGGYAIQKKHDFLFWSWWTSELLSGSEDEAKRIVEIKSKLL